MYVVVGKYKEGGVFRNEMRLKGMRKFFGCSWILSKYKFYLFFLGDRL